MRSPGYVDLARLESERKKRLISYRGSNPRVVAKQSYSSFRERKEMQFLNGQYQFGFNRPFSDFLWDQCDYYGWPRWTFSEHRDALKATLSY